VTLRDAMGRFVAAGGAGRSGDDMVIRPTIGHPGGPQPVRERAKEERRFADLGKRHGMMHRLRVMATRRGAAALARGAASGFARNFGARAVSRAAANPIGLIIGALVVGAVVVGRLATGRSFENMGQEVNKAILGDADEYALATMDARNALSGRDDVAGIVGRMGGASSQVRSVFEDMRRINKQERDGRTLFLSDPAFQVNNEFDIMVVALGDRMKQAAGRIDASLEVLKRALAQAVGSSKGVR
jgi:hypothetical protein